VALRSGLSVHALRFYEREGLLASPVERAADGRRVYSEQDLEWLELCIKLRSSGMPLAAILREHQQRVTAQIGALTECLDMITFKVALYEESLADGAADPIWGPCPAKA